MENKNLTAVEWLIQEHFGGIENCTPDFRNKIEQAKEKEKEQIMDAYSTGADDEYEHHVNLSVKREDIDCEKYYKETYGR